MRTTATDVYRIVFEQGLELAHKRGSTYDIDDIDLEFWPWMDIKLGHIGMTNERWTRLLFQYIEPRSFHDFLEKLKKMKRHHTLSYTFPVRAMHHSGNCLLAVVVKDSQLHAFSRTCLWAPTGLVDITLLSLIAQRIPKGHVRWQISQVQFDPVKSLSAYMLLKLKGGGPLGNELRKNAGLAKKGKLPVINWNDTTSRTMKRLERGKHETKDLSLDAYKENLYLEDWNDGEITPDTIAAKLKLGPRGGLKIRNFLRDEEMFFRWGSTHEYIGQDCWRWSSFSDPMVKLIMARFKQ